MWSVEVESRSRTLTMLSAISPHGRHPLLRCGARRERNRATLARLIDEPRPSQRIDAVTVGGMLLPRPDRMAILGDAFAVHAIAAAGAGNLPRLTSHGC